MLKVFAHATALVALVLPLRVQDPAQGPPADQDVRFRAGTDTVVLHVSVRDRRGRDVDNLPQSAFTILEDGSPQPITTFTNDDVPVTVGLVVDASVSMLPIRDQVVGAATAFAKASHPQDDMFALAFNERVRASLPEEAPFTADPEVLRLALASSIAARGRTALFDAVNVGLDYVSRGRYERRMLVVISDGGDNASRTPLDRVMARIQASNAVIFTIALKDPYGPAGDAKVMRALAEASGGQAFSPRNMDEVSDALGVIAHELRHSYTVGYSAPRPEQRGYRRVRVDVAAQNGQKLVVRTRAGYRIEDSERTE